MSATLYILAMIALCAMLNRMRGEHSYYAHIYGIVLAVVFALKLSCWWMLLTYPLFIFGECWGWGALIGALLANDDSDADEYARTALSVRGAWWWGGICFLLAFNGISFPVVSCGLFILSLGFPMCVQLAAKLGKLTSNTWGLAEWIYGALHGLILGILTGIAF